MNRSSQYYDLNPILSKTDINGKRPKRYIITSNRGDGKSHALEEHYLSFLRKKKYRKIGILCRYKGELEGIAERFFSTSDWMHEGMTYHTGKIYKLGYADLYVNSQHVGYGIAVSASDNIKDASGIFKEVDSCVWNEFQREDNRYLPREVIQLNSIISSISRGEGKQGRYVPFFFLSNFISLLSPIMCDLEIEKRLKSNTRFVRGDGFIFQQNLNLHALKAQQELTANAAGKNNYLGSTVIQYLNDNRESIYRPAGRYSYCETFIYNNEKYAILYYNHEKVYYVTKNVDKNFKKVYTKDRDNVSYAVFVPAHLQYYRKAFDLGRFSFEDLQCKSALISYIGYGCRRL